MSKKNKNAGEMSERQAERILETFENGSRNGKQWAHDVVLHRGTEKYQQSIETLNEAFRVKSINTVIKPLPPDHTSTKKAQH
jgi:tRNA1(Val) A37 N6-methylase TrmN6